MRRITKEKDWEHGWSLLPQSPNLPDLALTDYYLFRLQQNDKEDVLFKRNYL